MGPLEGIRIIEMAGIGPGPYACMLLSDLGAEVIRIDRPGGGGLNYGDNPADVLNRGRRSIALNLKNPEAVEVLMQLVETADVLIEGMRPGVMEKLGLGPDACHARNPKLVYGRMTGWGQTGPLAMAAGHDINYMAITGTLATIGTQATGPVPPINYVGDFGGGSMFLIMGVLAALIEAGRSGKGQVVDAAISDGSASLASVVHNLKAMGLWEAKRESNVLDGGAHYYGCYECADGKWVSVGALEPHFYTTLLQKLELLPEGEVIDYGVQFDKQQWPIMKAKLAQVFKSQPRDHWCQLLEGTDSCFAPVMELDEAPEYPHNQARGTFTSVKGVVQAAPAPKLSRTPGAIQRPPVNAGTDTVALLAELGLSEDRIAALKDGGAVFA